MSEEREELATCEWRPPINTIVELSKRQNEELLILYTVMDHARRVAEWLQEKYGDQVDVIHIDKELVFTKISSQLTILKLLREVWTVPYVLRHIHLFSISQKSAPLQLLPGREIRTLTKAPRKEESRRGKKVKQDEATTTNEAVVDAQPTPTPAPAETHNVQTSDVQNTQETVVEAKTQPENPSPARKKQKKNAEKRPKIPHKHRPPDPKPPMLEMDLSFLEQLDFKEKSIRVQAYPAARRQQIIDFLQDRNVHLEPQRGFTHLLTVLVHRDTVYSSLLEEPYFFAKDEDMISEKDVICRAFYKMRESLDRFNINYKEDWKVIDVGAAPGGISYFMATQICPKGLVAAIDPAELQLPRIPENLIHLKLKSQDSVPHLQSHGQFDLIMCDVNARPWPMMDMLEPLFPLLKIGGVFLWTIKLPKMNNENAGVIIYLNRVMADFRFRYGDFFAEPEVKWMLSNRYERMFYVKRIGEKLPQYEKKEFVWSNPTPRKNEA